MESSSIEISRTCRKPLDDNASLLERNKIILIKLDQLKAPFQNLIDDLRDLTEFLGGKPNNGDFDLF